MDRSFSNTSLTNSTDNFLDNLLFKATRMTRTDSEDQFRKFLERIPSTTNLSNYQAQQDQLQQHMAQFQQNNILSASAAPVGTQLPEGGSLNVGGIPRVPSLDLLRQLVQQQQSQGQNGSASKTPPAAEATEVKQEVVGGSPGGDSMASEVGIPSLPLITGLSLPLAMGFGSEAMAGQTLLASSVPPAPALQLGGEGGLPAGAEGSMSPQPSSEPRAATQKDSKAELRRARRMLSNRESARRSRRRKQEHLGVLEDQIQQLEEERDTLQMRLDKMGKQLATSENQNVALKRENEDLRRQLGGGAEGKDKKASGHVSKKQCTGL